jgi:hypothetical protein
LKTKYAPRADVYEIIIDCGGEVIEVYQPKCLGFCKKILSTIRNEDIETTRYYAAGVVYVASVSIPGPFRFTQREISDFFDVANKTVLNKSKEVLQDLGFDDPSDLGRRFVDHNAFQKTVRERIKDQSISTELRGTEEVDKQ